MSGGGGAPRRGDKEAPWDDMVIPAIAIHVHRSSQLNRSQHWDIYEATFQGTIVAVLRYRESSRQQALWDATLPYIPRLFASVHPNLVQFLGVVVDTDDVRSSMLVMERQATSLYDLLHVHHIALTDAAVVHIALDILHAITYCNGCGLGHLTSRKVLLDAGGNVKLLGLFQRDILDIAGVPNVITPYSPPLLQQPPPADAIAMADDMFVFGVLLWEVCCGELPTVELHHRIAQVSVRHPQTEFESLVRRCLDETPGNRPQPSEVCDTLLKLQMSLPLLAGAEAAVAMRFGAVEARQSPTAAPGPTVVARRLEAVEAQVLEEQRNFDVVVGQLEFANTEIATLNGLLTGKENERLEMHAQVVAALAQKDEVEQAMRDAIDARDKWAHQVKTLEHQVATLNARNQSQLNDMQHCKREYDHMRVSVQAIEQERVEMAQHLAATKDAMAKEKALSDELNVRWQQTIKRVEDERRLRDKAERVVAEVRDQNKTLLDQVKRWHPDTGSDTLERTQAHDAQVQSLEQHIQKLLLEMVEFRGNMAAMEATVQAANSALQEAQTQCTALQDQFTTTQRLLWQAQDACKSHERTIQSYETTTAALETKLVSVQSELKATENALTRELKKRQDEELALKSRRCLDLTCDAPPFLIQPSGYCKGCDERRERDKADRVSKLALARQNQPPNQLVRDAYGRGVPTLLELLDNFHTHVDVLVAGFKQLHWACETNGSVKDSLGDAGAFKQIVTWMGMYPDDVALQLAAIRLVGVLAFNHDVNRVRLVCEGCLEQVLGAMARHVSDKAIQQASCTTLTNLAHNCEGNRRKILLQLGIERVLDSMQAFPHDTSIQQGCCWALISLAGSDFMCEHIAARGGVGGIVAAMLNCHADAAVQYYGSWALLNLVAGLESVQTFAKHEGAVEVCEAAMACFADHGGIQDKAGTVVTVLTDISAQENDTEDS
ncbi:TKL protein kinase, variant [Aphanomyces astaci]|uniref:TKL protein kinase, variant n=1 Tax=Aphanomyces astaci TaxID=112090 RepID=W4GYS1_APHAT|nr:TKL protein kinase, variant [Aphanomyces astaci]ETV84817.1 TKL protein kinase, variant [Aphanomyces astaci]|eukprot:XP_009826509.1 TKL protein kinase, variant [Aphanomyces astaci]